jgi:transcription termination/antitermination protein NusA
MATAISANKMELLAIADAVAREKSIDRLIVIEAMEEAIQKAARARYGIENDIRAKIDPRSGDTRLWRVLEVVELVEDAFKQISVADAQPLKPGAELGDYIIDPLPAVEFGRIASQTAKQVIVQKVREAERDRQYEEFKDRKGEIITGVVKRTEFGHVVVDLGRAEGVIRRDQLIPREQYRLNDRVRAYLMDVRRENRGPQIFLSRAHGDFMAKLFAQEVPEIYDGVIEIKAVARDPGSRAKIGVVSNDSSIDPVGACVGMRGSRVQAVVQELQGEKVDIIPWSPDPATFIVNALQPAEVAKVVLDEEDGRIEVVVPDDQLSLAIGRRGQNVRLASQLTGWHIDIITESTDSERRQKDFTTRSEMFMKELDVDETLAQLLVAEGFTELEEVAYIEPEELAGIEGFDENLASELQNRATEALERQMEAAREERRKLGVEDAVAAIEGLTEPMLVVLGKAGVKTLDDLGDLATDELIGKKDGVLKEFSLSEEDGNAIIMAARQHWFE